MKTAEILITVEIAKAGCEIDCEEFEISKKEAESGGCVYELFKCAHVDECRKVFEKL